MLIVSNKNVQHKYKVVCCRHEASGDELRWVNMGRVRPYIHHLPTRQLPMTGKRFHTHIHPLSTKFILISTLTRANAVRNSYNITRLLFPSMIEFLKIQKSKIQMNIRYSNFQTKNSNKFFKSNFLEL